MLHLSHRHWEFFSSSLLFSHASRILPNFLSWAICESEHGVNNVACPPWLRTSSACVSVDSRLVPPHQIRSSSPSKIWDSGSDNAVNSRVLWYTVSTFRGIALPSSSMSSRYRRQLGTQQTAMAYFTVLFQYMPGSINETH